VSCWFYELNIIVSYRIVRRWLTRYGALPSFPPSSGSLQLIDNGRIHYSPGRIGPPGCLALARWAGLSAGQVGRHVKCWMRKWNRGGGPGTLS